MQGGHRQRQIHQFFEIIKSFRRELTDPLYTSTDLQLLKNNIQLLLFAMEKLKAESVKALWLFKNPAFSILSVTVIVIWFSFLLWKQKYETFNVSCKTNTQLDYEHNIFLIWQIFGKVVYFSSYFRRFLCENIVLFLDLEIFFF